MTIIVVLEILILSPDKHYPIPQKFKIGVALIKELEVCNLIFLQETWWFLLVKFQISARVLHLYETMSQLRIPRYPARVEVFGWIFVRNAVNTVNFGRKCGDCGECGEKKTFHRISPLFLDKFTAKITEFFTIIHRICFTRFIKFTRNIIKVRGSNPCVEVSFFVRMPRTRWI